MGKHVPFWPAKLESAGKCERDRTIGRMYYAAPSVEESMKSARDTMNHYIWPSLGCLKYKGLQRLSGESKAISRVTRE